MLMPSIFGESLFDDFDNLMNFSFPDVDKTLYGKHAKNMMKTDVKEKDNGYEVAYINCGISRRGNKVSIERRNDL